MEKTKRLYKEDFYPVYEEMCQDHGFPPIGYGNVDEMLVYTKDDVIMYACLLWNTFSDMCLLGFPVSNLQVPAEEREGMLTKFFQGIEAFCKTNGYKVIWTTSATDRVIKSLEESGFQKGDENVQTYIKVVP